MGRSDGNSTVFGPDGVIQRMGDRIYDARGRAWMRSGDGDMVWGPDGSSAARMGGTIWQSRGTRSRTILRVGETWYAGSDTYWLCGSTLYGPAGKSWCGVEDAETAEEIILTDF